MDAPYRGACSIDSRLDLPLVVERNFMLAPMTGKGFSVLMVVDTGAETTLVTPQAASILDLAPDPKRFSILRGAGGSIESRNAMLAGMSLGTAPIPVRSVGVHAIDNFSVPGYVVGGLLGADILSRYEVEIDAPHRRLSLYATRGCDGLTPLPGPSIRVPLAPTANGLLYAPINIDGRPVRALLDSGARSSLLTRRFARSVGVTDQELAADPGGVGQGVDRRNLEFRLHRFRTVDLGSIAMHDVGLNVTDMRLPNVDMLFGADWIVRNHIWISYSVRMLFVMQTPQPGA